MSMSCKDRLDYMEELFSLFNELSESQRTLVLNTPSLLDAFCAEASENLGVDTEIVKAHLSKLGAMVKGEVERVVRLSESYGAVKDKSMRMIERQNDRDLWYEQFVLEPLSIAYAVRDLMNEGMDYDSASTMVQAKEFSADLDSIKQRLSRSPDLSSIVVKPRVVRWDDGSTQAQREKKAQMYHEVLSILKATQVKMTKTQILRELGKDNSSWRKVCSEVLEYMVSREIIVSVGNKFIHGKNYHEREQTYHRTVYEMLCDSPMTQTSILKKIGYQNTKGRAKLKKALELMMVEGLVDTDGKKWFVP